MKTTRTYKAPAGVDSISVGGQHFTVVDGTIEVPIGHEDSILRGNGFTPVDDDVKQGLATADDLHKVDG
jgi:hypothetical protein